MTDALPAVVAIVGRPNVGKSTLFNVLTGTRDAIVADVPGVTRDRQYGYGRVGPFPYVIIDTGGVVEKPSGIEMQMRIQTMRAVEEADRLLFVVDARAGITREDHYVASELRRAGKPVTIALNKAESLDRDVVGADFHALGFGMPQAVSSAHSQGLDALMRVVLDGLEEPVPPQDDTGQIRIAVIGKPNVGKSTLVNRLIGEERVIAADQPGTTRDSIFVPFERDGHKFPAHRHRRGAPPFESGRRGRTGERRPHAAGHRARAHRDHDARRARRRGRAGRQRARDGTRARPRNPDRRQQVGRHSHREARPDPQPARGEARLRALRTAAFHLGASRQRRGRARRRDGARVRIRDARAAHQVREPRARRRARSPPAPARARPPHQAALRPSGRPQTRRAS